MKIKLIILTVVMLVVVGYVAINSSRNNKNESPTTSSASRSTVDQLIPVEEISHGHGLAIDVSDPNSLYIATHHGLLVLKDEKQLYRIGESGDDFMGFSPHPTNPNVFFTSGHPSFGGNLGFQRSDDGGVTWQKVSDGIRGPVDFHAMTVSPVNPDLIFGWYQATLQRTTDGGKSWEIVQNTQFPIVSLAADTKDENILYAASPQGLFVSRNKGVSFDLLFDGFVSVVVVNPPDAQNLLSFSEKQGLAKSNDAGKTWETINVDFNGEMPLYIAFNKQNTETVYLLTERNSIYKSLNNGVDWSKIR